MGWGAVQYPSDREKNLLKHLVLVETDFSKRAIVLHFNNTMNSRGCQSLCLLCLSDDAFDSWSQVLAQYDDAQYAPELSMSMLKHECLEPLGRTGGASSFKNGSLGVTAEVAAKHHDEGALSKSSSFSEGSTEFNDVHSDTRQMSD